MENLRRIIGALNSTFISLIPKILNSLSFEDFKPISLWNMVYKMGAKLLATRLKKAFLREFQKNSLVSCITRKYWTRLDYIRNGLVP